MRLVLGVLAMIVGVVGLAAMAILWLSGHMGGGDEP